MKTKRTFRWMFYTLHFMLCLIIQRNGIVEGTKLPTRITSVSGMEHTGTKTALPSHAGSTIHTTPPSNTTNILNNRTVQLSTTTLPVRKLTEVPQTQKYLPDYKIYHNISTVMTRLKVLEKHFPNLLKINTSGKTYQKRDIMTVTITNFTKRANETKEDKKNITTILLVYGTYGGQLFPVESMLQLVDCLVDGRAKACKNERTFASVILNRARIIIVPVWNVDGRAKVEETHNYCYKSTGNGIDLERNFDWEFTANSKKGMRGNAGPRAFSEKESLFLKNLADDSKPDAFITFNLYDYSGRIIYTPYSDEKSKRMKRRPSNFKAMNICASKTAARLNVSFSQQHQWWIFGEANKLLTTHKLSGGRSIDYMKGERNISFTYHIAMWSPIKNANNFDCFLDNNPTNNKLQEELDRVFPLYKPLFECIIEWKLSQYTKLGWVVKPFADDILNYGLLALITFVLVSMTICICRKKSKRCRSCRQKEKRERGELTYNLLDVSEDDEYYTDETEI